MPERQEPQVPRLPPLESLDDLVSTTDAAIHVGVDASTIRQWASRGYLAKAGLDERNRPMYRLIDVLRAARDTRQRAIGKRRKG
jgi:hypothetical protein